MLEQIKFIHFEEISSTQDYAQLLIEKKLLTQPCLIYTDYQTKGRGQLQKQWHGTPQKNIYMTLAIPCNIFYFYSNAPTCYSVSLLAKPC